MTTNSTAVRELSGFPSHLQAEVTASSLSLSLSNSHTSSFTEPAPQKRINNDNHVCVSSNKIHDLQLSFVFSVAKEERGLRR